MERWISRAVFAVALVVLVVGASGGAGWNAAADHAVLAARAEHTAASPLYGVVASVFVLLPAGEPGFRLALLDALLGACLLAGVVAAARALVPKQPLVGLVGVVLLALAPAFRDAAGFAGPAMLAGAGTVWLFATLLAYLREPTAQRAVLALACVGIVIGAAPWLGFAYLAISVAIMRGRVPLFALAMLGIALVLLWWRALGSLPDAIWRWSLPGASPVLIGAGFAGALFGAITGLAGARWLAAGIALAALHPLAFSADCVPLLGLLAIAAAIVPAAIARAVEGRHVAALAGIPLVLAALVVDPAFSVDDPADSPARLASDIVDWAPSGPGAIIANHPTTWSAIDYETVIAGRRADLALAPLLTARSADDLAVNALRSGAIAVSDRAAFGVLQSWRALPRGRGFQLLLEIPPMVPALAPPPAHYASRTGEEQAVLLANARALYEATGLRLDAAARAAGQTERFRAADLAILATAQPVHPPMSAFIPTFHDRPGRWMLDLVGDDLAWVAGLEQPALPAGAPLERVLHAKWRALIEGGKGDVQELGPVAVIKTAEMLYVLGRKKNHR